MIIKPLDKDSRLFIVRNHKLQMIFNIRYFPDKAELCVYNFNKQNFESFEISNLESKAELFMIRKSNVKSYEDKAILMTLFVELLRDSLNTSLRSLIFALKDDFNSYCPLITGSWNEDYFEIVNYKYFEY